MYQTIMPAVIASGKEDKQGPFPWSHRFTPSTRNDRCSYVKNKHNALNTYLHFSWCSGQSVQPCHCSHWRCHWALEKQTHTNRNISIIKHWAEGSPATETWYMSKESQPHTTMPGTEEQTTPADFHCLVFYISENGKNLQSENPNLNRTLKSPSPRILTKATWLKLKLSRAQS